MKYSRTLLKNFYKTMLRIRLCEERFVHPIINGEIKCPVHLYSGQEAVAAGVCAALRATDYVFGNHRSHGHFLAKGGSLKKLVAEVYCRETGCSRGRGGSMHLIDVNKGMLGSTPIVAGTISLALGASLASKIRKDRRVTVSFFGDGAAGEGVMYESLNFAALNKLPIIFVCENNLYSTHMSLRECRTKNNIYRIGGYFGVRSYRSDGNDVLKVYERVNRAVKLCRSGNGPVFIEFMTYRMRGHVGPNDNIHGLHTDIRPKKEIAEWRKKDPIRKFSKYLAEEGVLSEKDLESIKEKVNKEIAGAFLFAKRSPFPKKEELGRYVFRE
ncbi:hypothetical protein AUJ67_05160 [Candidatus Desantisbacteria bacterium CG1_02_49_89]|nr:MAG: hypothetical protein AUJ67_05160 [Candidatus Desantisbacteria bacterium CG1_02_49_89]